MREDLSQIVPYSDSEGQFYLEKKSNKPTNLKKNPAHKTLDRGKKKSHYCPLVYVHPHFPCRACGNCRNKDNTGVKYFKRKAYPSVLCSKIRLQANQASPRNMANSLSWEQDSEFTQHPPFPSSSTNASQTKRPLPHLPPSPHVI